MNITVNMLELVKRLVLICCSGPGVTLETKNQETSLKRPSDVKLTVQNRQKKNKNQAGHFAKTDISRDSFESQRTFDIFISLISLITVVCICCVSCQVAAGCRALWSRRAVPFPLFSSHVSPCVFPCVLVTPTRPPPDPPPVVSPLPPEAPLSPHAWAKASSLPAQ